VSVDYKLEFIDPQSSDVMRMDRSLPNLNKTLCIDAMAFDALTGKYEVTKRSWA